MSGVRERSYEPITRADLERLAALAAVDREARFTRRPRWGVYRDRVICVALCQGAAQHCVDGKNGVKDFDVWTFFAEHPEGPFPYRWLTAADLGPSQFGRRAFEPGPHTFSGRRVDFNARSLPERPDVDPTAALQRYLGAARTESARRLAEKAVVIVEPLAFRGVVAWTATGDSRRAAGTSRRGTSRKPPRDESHELSVAARGGSTVVADNAGERRT